MSALVLTSATIQVGTAWTGTAPGTPGTQTISGTVSSPSDISAYVFQVEAPWNVDTPDASNFGSGGYVVQLAGMKSVGGLKLGINQDYAGAAIDSLVRGWFGTTVYIDVKPTSAVRSATNPSAVYAAIVSQYIPVVGQVGNKAMMSLQWQVTGAFAVLTS